MGAPKGPFAAALDPTNKLSKAPRSGRASFKARWSMAITLNGLPTLTPLCTQPSTPYAQMDIGTTALQAESTQIISA